jgi:hypothetical protein
VVASGILGRELPLAAGVVRRRIDDPGTCLDGPGVSLSAIATARWT